MLLFDADRFPGLDADVVVVAGTPGHGDADTLVVQVLSVGARAAIYWQEAVSAAVLLRGQGPAGQLTPLQPVGEGLRGRTGPGVFIC